MDPFKKNNLYKFSSLTTVTVTVNIQIEANLVNDCWFLFFFIILFCEMFCRFGGSEFPPIILFKIFIHSGGHGVKYYCGKKVIKPASEVTKSICFLCGTICSIRLWISINSGHLVQYCNCFVISRQLVTH